MNDNPSIEDLIKKNKSDENSGITQTQMTINDVDRSFEELQTAKKAAVLGYEYVSLERFPVDMEAVALISKEEAIKAKVIPFYHEEGVVRLGVVDPTSSEMEFVRKKLEKDRYKVKVLMISKSSFSEAKDAYDRLVKQKIQKSDFINLTKSDIEKKSKAFFEKIKSDINS